MQRAEPPPPQTVTVLLVAIDGDTQSRITDQLPPPHYQFVTSSTVNLALDLLEKEKLHLDLVLSNVSSKDDDDGYNFIAQVQRLRKNIPHIAIFEAVVLGDPEIIRANKIKLGVCYILWKPVGEQSNEIKYIRQHVFRRSTQNEGSSSQKNLERESDEQPSEKERESSKKQWMVWDKDLNALFVKAVNKLGKGAGPIRILEFMNRYRDLPSLTAVTREKVGRLTSKQVGSHLQKHREKEKEKKLHQPCNLLETPTTDSPPQAHVVCQQQIQHEHHEQHLPCQPMHNSGVTSLIGNGVNNLTSMHQPDGITSDILQQQDIAPNLTSGMQHPCSSSRIINQNQVFGTSSRSSNMQQPETQQLGQNLTSTT